MTLLKANALRVIKVVRLRSFKMYIFKCLDCPREITVSTDEMKTHQGRCRSCTTRFIKRAAR